MNMMKKKFLRLCLMMAALLFIVSCKSELLEDDSQSVKRKQNLMVKQLRYDELKKQSPAIVEKISKFQKQNLAEVNSRIYQDTEEGFSVDTEKSLYIEDGEGNKTYTFKIVRAENNSGILENLVLKDVGNSEFEAYISIYDNVAVQNCANLSLEQIKSHVTMKPIGKVNGSDIFGRANANQCFIMVPEFVDVFYTGEICGASLHYFGETCTHPIKATPGFTMTSIQYTSYDMCQSGGSTTGNGSGTVNTGPYSPQGNGGSYDDLFPSPCKKAIKTFTKNAGVKTATVNLVTKVSDSVEHGFSVMNDVSSTSQNPVQNLSVGSYGTVDIPLHPTHPYIVIAHTHNSPSTVTYSVPSWEDMDELSMTIQQFPNFADVENLLFITITADGTRYAFMIEDISAFFNYFYYSGKDPNTYSSTLFNEKENNRRKYYYGEKKNGVETPAKILENTVNKEQDLKYFMEIANNAGLNVFEMDVNFNKLTQITMTNNQIARTECK